VSRELNRRELLALAAGAAAVPARAWARSPGPLRGPLPLERQPVAFFSKQLQFLDYPALAETVAEAGFDGIDLTVRPGGHVEPARAEEDLPRAVEAARQAGLAIPMMTTAIATAEDGHAAGVLRAAAGAGVGHYRMGYARYDEASGVAATIEALVPRWRELAALNASLGIRGGYQNHAGRNVGAAVWDLWRLLERVGSPWLGCQYDVRHAVVEGAHSWVRALDAIAPFVHTLAVKDFLWSQGGGSRRDAHVPLGEGAVDLGEWSRRLRAEGVSAPISLHCEYLEPDEGAPVAARRKAALEAMRRDLRRLRAVLDAGAKG